MYKRVLSAGFVVALVLATVSPLSHADEPTAQETSLAPEKNFGVYLSFLGDSSPAIVSLNLAFEPNELVRLNAGLGLSLGYAFGVGAKVLFFPSWAVRPFLGANLGAVYTDFPSTFVLALENIFNDTNARPDFDIYGFYGPTFGFDWKTAGGFNLTLGGNVWITHADGSVHAGILPFVNVGWFF